MWIFAGIVIIGLILFAIDKENQKRSPIDDRLAQLKKQKVIPFSFSVKGTAYRTKEEIAAAVSLNINDLLILESEPNNPYDKNAIKVLTLQGYLVGYVDKEHNQFILRQWGRILKCYVSSKIEGDIPYLYATIDIDNA